MKSGDSSESYYKSKNKTWKRKDDDKFKKAVKQELKLLMKGKDPNAMNVDDGDRKRKADSDSDDASMHSAKSNLSSSSETSSASLNMLQKEVAELEFESKKLKSKNNMESMDAKIPKKST